MAKSKVHQKRRLKKAKTHRDTVAWSKRRGPQWLAEKEAEYEAIRMDAMNNAAVHGRREPDEPSTQD